MPVGIKDMIGALGLSAANTGGLWKAGRSDPGKVACGEAPAAGIVRRQQGSIMGPYA